MAAAVSRLSPVIITTCTPAAWAWRTACLAWGRTSSRMPTNPMRVRSEKRPPPSPTGTALWQSTSTRTAWAVSSFQRNLSSLRESRGRARPSPSTYLVQLSSSFSGAPLTKVRPSSSVTAAYLLAESKGTRRATCTSPLVLWGRAKASSARSVALPPSGPWGLMTAWLL